MEEIIDGVDVSGCIYKKDDIFDCGNPACGGYKCEGQICLYKQVKMLEQENAKLKESNENLLRRLSTKMLSDEHYDIRSILLLEAENLRLEVENAKLKEALERIKEVLSFCYSEESTEIPCIDCKYYKECGLQPDDYVIKIASEVLKDE